MSGVSLNKIKVIAIVGPTASGKTKFSIDLAQKVNGEIISADSRLVYKGFNIGTAKPTKAEMSNIVHHMIDVVEPDVEYSAGLYKDSASKIIEEISSKGKVPIIVGGTGLYIDILLKGYSLPGVVANKELRESLSKKSNNELFEMLSRLDSSALTGLEINDRKKIIRAIEIITSTGKKLEESRGMSESIYDIEWIGKNFKRNELYKRIDERVDDMIDAGLVDETNDLLNKYGRVYNLVNTIGYREIMQYFDGKLSLNEAIELLKKNTRNYAKRQLTWFRKNENIKWDVYPEKLPK